MPLGDRLQDVASLLRLSAIASILLLPLIAGCASTTTQRPYRFEIAAPVPATTQLVAQRMSTAGDPELRTTITDPMHGFVLAPWRMVGASDSITIIPPGEDHEWTLERYRAVVQPYGWSSAVLFDVERVACDKSGFRWDAVNLWGNCRPMSAEIDANTQARIDGKASRVQNARP